MPHPCRGVHHVSTTVLSCVMFRAVLSCAMLRAVLSCAMFGAVLSCGEMDRAELAQLGRATNGHALLPCDGRS